MQSIFKAGRAICGTTSLKLKEAKKPLNTLPSLKRIILIIAGTLLAGNILGGMITGGLEKNPADILIDALFMAAFFFTIAYLFIYRPFIGAINDLLLKQNLHKEAEEKLQTLLDTMPDGVWFKDGDGRWLAVNKSGLALFGLENAGYQGKRDAEQAPEGSFHFPALAHCQNTDKAAWDAGRLSRVEERVPQPNGIDRTFDVLKVPLFNADGSRKGLVVLGRDITVEKEALAEQRRLASAVEQSDEAIFVIDTKGLIQYVNPALERMTGYTKEEVIGKSPALLESGKTPPSTIQAVKRALRAGVSWSGGFVNRRKDGVEYEVSTTVSPVFDDNGAVVNYVVVDRDVTEKKKLERARQYFTDVTSHEMITPLSKLHMLKVLLANLRPYNTDPEKLATVEKGLAKVYAEFKRIVDLTSLLVQVSAVPVPGAIRPFALRRPLLNIINHTITTIEAERRMVVMEVDMESLPVETLVIGDPGVLEAALREVLSNAVKFTQDGGIIRFSAALQKNEAVITAADEGIGIPADRLQEAFDPFFSLENPLHHSTGQFKFKGGGLGVGLTVAALAMRQNGGSLTLHSDGENKGSVVTLRLPLA